MFLILKDTRQIQQHSWQSLTPPLSPQKMRWHNSCFSLWRRVERRDYTQAVISHFFLCCFSVWFSCFFLKETYFWRCQKRWICWAECSWPGTTSLRKLSLPVRLCPAVRSHGDVKDEGRKADDMKHTLPHLTSSFSPHPAPPCPPAPRFPPQQRPPLDRHVNELSVTLRDTEVRSRLTWTSLVLLRGGSCAGSILGFFCMCLGFIAALLVLDEDLAHQLRWTGDLAARLQLHKTDPGSDLSWLHDDNTLQMCD